MRASQVAAASIILALCPHIATSQNPAIKLSLVKPSWVSSESFSELTSIRVLSNGIVLAADTKDVEVHLFDATGKHLRQIGRKGAGPGEYHRPKLIALPADSTLLLDVDARRYVIIDPAGKIIRTESVSAALGSGANTIAASDPQGRLLFGEKLAALNEVNAITPIGRWKRGTDRFDTLTMFHAEDPAVRPVKAKNAPLTNMTGQTRVVFAATDDWIAAPSGRIAIIHAVPYRVDWVDLNGKITQGSASAYTRVPVTDADRKRYEPNGPPYVRTYAEFKSPFATDYSIVDDRGSVWVPRFEAANSSTRRWDVFGADGALKGTVTLPSNRLLMAIRERDAFVRFTDSDGLQWIERYAR